MPRSNPRTSSPRTVALLAGLFPLALAVPAHAQATSAPAAQTTAPPATPSPFEGAWRWVGGPSEVRAPDAAIDRAVHGMGWIVERIAAGRLRSCNDVPPAVTIAVRNDAIDVAASGRPRVVSRVGQARTLQTGQGQSAVVTQRVQDGALVRVARTNEGTRREEYRVEGGALVNHVTVSSPRLPCAVTYRLTYRH